MVFVFYCITGLEAKHATEFLECALNIECPIILGMMSDAGDETMLLIRRLDKEHYSASNIHRWISCYIDRNIFAG